MSCNYADGLSPYHDKGQLGLEERFDAKSVVSAKVALLTKWINEANHVVVHTGAGISTSAGIPDFRGPRGVWTLQAKGEKPDTSTEFNDAVPTITHMAITKLVERGKVKYVVSQNIDGLHLRSNLPRKYLSELHGNMFTEQCNACGRQFVRSSAAPTVGQKSLNKPCPTLKANGRPCRGRLHDTILDWEHNLPENDLGMADYHSCMADLSLCLGTTMQIVPSGNLPLYTKKHGGKLVICNLQPTKHNRKADLIIHSYVDEIMTLLMKNLNLKIPKYSVKNDPTKLTALSPEKFLEWTISDYALKKMKKVYEEKCGTKEARKRLEMIDDDLPLSVAKNLKRTRVKDDEDSDLEVLDVIVKPKRSGRESASKRSQKKSSQATYNSTITVKKVTPPAKKGKYETEKITIKKNVTPTKTKYEIVQPKPKKVPKCEIVYSTDNDLCSDLDMICESDDDEMTNNYTYNFKRYLYDEKDLKKEEDDKKNVEKVEVVEPDGKASANDNAVEIKDEIKTEDERKISADDIVKEDDRSEEEKGLTKECEHGGDDDNKEGEDSTREDGPVIDLDSNAEIRDNEEEPVNPIHVDEDPSAGGEDRTGDPLPSESRPPPDARDEPGIGSPDSADVVRPAQAPDGDESNGVAGGESAKSGETPKESEGGGREEAAAPESGAIEKSKTPEEELADYIKSAEMETETGGTAASGEETTEATREGVEGETKKPETVPTHVGPHPSNSSGGNDDSAIDQLVNNHDSAEFNTSTNLPTCSVGEQITENYEFYSNEYNSCNNTTGLDYVDGNYYNNF